MKTTVYLYCRNEAPYLSRDAISGEKYVLSDTKDYFNRGDLNGFVCFRCECEEAFDLSGPMDDAERYLDLTKAHDLVEYYGMRIALTYDQLKGRRGGSKSLWPSAGPTSWG